MAVHHLLVVLVCGAFLSAVARAAPDPDRIGTEVDGLISRSGTAPAVSVWLGPANGPAIYSRDADRARPSASAIKTFFLVELFDKYKADLDAPLAGSPAVLNDDHHPAISHFTPEQRAEIRRDLGGKSVRFVARAMMEKEQVSNAVYNAAANLVTADLGGPEALTNLIHRRDESFSTVFVRRYMLRDRKTPGDNECTAGSLASLYRHLATSKLSGIDAGTMSAIREILDRSDTPLGRHFDKTGNLASDPLTAVRAGWYDGPSGPIIYVVMLEQPTPGGHPRQQASDALGKLADTLASKLVEVAAKP